MRFICHPKENSPPTFTYVLLEIYIKSQSLPIMAILEGQPCSNKRIKYTTLKIFQYNNISGLMVPGMGPVLFFFSWRIKIYSDLVIILKLRNLIGLAHWTGDQFIVRHLPTENTK